MSFNKRYITKDSILSCIKNGESLSRLTKADALIMDNWSTRFFDNYSFDYQKMRDELNTDVMFQSNYNATYEHKNFNSLKRLSNILENLIKDPSWTEILLTTNILGSEGITEEMHGKFPLLKDYCINKIIKHYTLESREKSINNILG